MAKAKLPRLSLYQRQRARRVDLPWLRRSLRKALPLCLEGARPGAVPLRELPEIEASVVSDPEIARVHAEFMDDPSPTDVITFHHGEILVSADTAALRGPEHGHTPDQELLLYLIHGLLHLGGWEDHDPAERADMHALQDRIHAAVLGGAD